MSRFDEIKIKAYNEIAQIAWSEDNAEAVLQRILGVLYSAEQSIDGLSGELEDYYAMKQSMDTDPDPGAFSDESVDCY